MPKLSFSLSENSYKRLLELKDELGVATTSSVIAEALHRYDHKLFPKKPKGPKTPRGLEVMRPEGGCLYRVGHDPYATITLKPNQVKATEFFWYLACSKQKAGIALLGDRQSGKTTLGSLFCLSILFQNPDSIGFYRGFSTYFPYGFGLKGENATEINLPNGASFKRVKNMLIGTPVISQIDEPAQFEKLDYVNPIQMLVLTGQGSDTEIIDLPSEYSKHILTI